MHKSVMTVILSAATVFVSWVMPSSCPYGDSINLIDRCRCSEPIRLDERLDGR